MRRTDGNKRRWAVVVVALATVAASAVAYGVLRADPTPTSAAGHTPTPGGSSPQSLSDEVLTPTGAAPSPPSSMSARPTPSRSAGKAAPSARTTAKKGVAVWDFPAVSAGLKAVGASWYYNWGPSNDRMPGPSGVEFVPMIWGVANVTDATLSKVKGEGRVLLGFNEPDMDGQANMTPAKALELWPRLQATGMRLGSPAVAWGAADSGRWLDQFMAGARRRGYRVDFIALHWYGSDFSSAERYAWFGLPATADSKTGLYRASGSLTAAGQAYRADDDALDGDREQVRLVSHDDLSLAGGRVRLPRG